MLRTPCNFCTEAMIVDLIAAVGTVPRKVTTPSCAEGVMWKTFNPDSPAITPATSVVRAASETPCFTGLGIELGIECTAR